MGALNCCLQTTHCIETTNDSNAHVPAARQPKKSPSPRDQQPAVAAASAQPQLASYSNAPPSRERRPIDRSKRRCIQDDPKAVLVRRCDEPTRVASKPAAPLSRRYRSLPCAIQESQHQQPLLSAQLRSQSLDSGHARVRLAQYLCTCNDCPRAQAINTALCRLHPKINSVKASLTHRGALLRVLRGCATYDETKALTPELFFVAQRLLLESNGDEDATFRFLVTKYGL